jgi:hypothetical protein
MQDFRFIDLFAGLGGFHLALGRLGGRCVFAAEWKQHLRDLYEDNFGLTPEGDITLVHPNDIPDHDVLTADQAKATNLEAVVLMRVIHAGGQGRLRIGAYAPEMRGRGQAASDSKQSTGVSTASRLAVGSG